MSDDPAKPIDGALWYDQPPAAYAKALRFRADRCDETAARWRADGTGLGARYAVKWDRDARRLRAMALLCDRATAARAGDVDFMRLQDPGLKAEETEAIIAEINGGTEHER